MALGAFTPKARARGQEPSPPSEEELARWLSERRNWGRWGDDDEKGAINLITPEVSSDEYKSQVPVHGVIFSYGGALLDNAHLGDLAVAAEEEERYEFMLSVQPLRVERGTGSPVNPTALF